MKRISLAKAIEYLKADNTYRRDVYLVHNHLTNGKYFVSGKVNGYSVCRVDRSQITLSSLADSGFKTAFIDE